MAPASYLVSFHHRIRLDCNLPPLSCLYDEETKRLVRGAKGVLMPKYLSPARYRAISKLANSHFPDLTGRFYYRGKATQIRLFRRLGIDHPETRLFPTPDAAIFGLETEGPPLAYPFVVKGDSGGGGHAVFPAESEKDYLDRLKLLPEDEPVLAQRWVEHGGMDLRVVVVGSKVKSYFRVGGGSFYNNVCRGAVIDYGLHPEKQAAGKSLALKVSKLAGIDMAGFDVMFPEEGPPLLIEVNFFFGKKGLGGPEGFDELFLDAVMEWKASLQ
jgi:ribosomal protein S6--L-glutamate ligase